LRENEFFGADVRSDRLDDERGLHIIDSGLKTC
jgi:hypothetical protein